MSPPTTAAAAGIDNTTRKKWDKSEYAAKALQRVEEEFGGQLGVEYPGVGRAISEIRARTG